MLVVASWLSPRTREVPDGRGFGYLDLTGNVSIQRTFTLRAVAAVRS